MLGTACFFKRFLVKKDQNVRFQADFQGNPLIIERQFFSKRNGFYDRYILFFRCFFGRGNFHHLRATGKTFSLDVCPSIQFHQLLLKPNLFFRCFFIQKRENVRFQTIFSGKPYIIERQFSQHVTVSYVRYSVFV